MQTFVKKTETKIDNRKYKETKVRRKILE